MKIRNGIYSKNVEKAREKVAELIGEQKVVYEKHFKDGFEIETEYEIFRYCLLSNNSRGYRHDFAYVDTTFLTIQDIETINCVVKPSLSNGISLYQDQNLYQTKNHLFDFRV